MARITPSLAGLTSRHASTASMLRRPSSSSPCCATPDVRRARCAPESACIDRPFSSILDRLEKDGLIRRGPSSYDGRRFEIRLTRAGTIVAETVELEIGEVEAEIAAYSSRAERAGTVAVFEACVAIGRPGRTNSR